MTISLDHAQVYDVECYPNTFTLTAETLFGETVSTWEISDFRNDIKQLIQWFNWCAQNQILMIGFNNLRYDYLIIHYIFHNPNCTAQQIYQENQRIFASNDRFGNMIWDRDRFAPQLDLMSVHHFDNVAKTTSLKALQINMRLDDVQETPVPFGTALTEPQVDDVIGYNAWDVGSTKQFAHYSMKAIEFRIGIIPTFGIEALNYNDTKIGERMLEERLGKDVCFDWSSGRKQRRQSPRYKIELSEIIFPYIYFRNSEFQRVLDFMKAQTLTPDDLTDPDAKIRTKGVFTDLSATVGGLEFHFGTGGVHASVEAQKFEATDEWLIRDIDVASLYPSITIANRLGPEHLGEAFIAEYAKIPVERKLHAKGTQQNATLKLAANGAWGKSNSKWSFLFDPKYAMTVPINGQLLICMLAEWLVDIPTITLIQCNTDGITYRIHKDYLEQCKEIEQRWEQYTMLVLESVDYSRMWIRDVNSYIAEDTDGGLKQKGAYWHPDPMNYADSISLASPPSWHKDLSNIVSTRAAVFSMVNEIDPELFIRTHSDPFDFMCRAKVNKASRLMLGDRQIQSTSRYYVALDGEPLSKVSPPPAGAVIGTFKRASKVSQAEYDRVMVETGGQWDERVCTKNKSTYQDRVMNIQAGLKIAVCNRASDFDFANVDYNWYINEARKLIVS